LAAQSPVRIGTSKDNTLYESPTGNLSNGAGSLCFVGVTGGGGKRRALVAFDVAARIPAGSVITKVDLVMTAMKAASFSPATIGLHDVLADWGEGASVAGSGQGGGGLAQPNDATWIHTFFNTGKW